jgi:hypothetical protein
MESAKAGAVAGEGKAVTSERSRCEKRCGVLERVESEAGENGFRGADWLHALRFATQCLVRSHARGEQGWESGHLEPLFFAGPLRGL